MENASYHEKLEQIDDAELMGGLWEMVRIYFDDKENRQKALLGARELVSLFRKSGTSNEGYRTREEIIEASGNSRLVSSMIKFLLLERHPDWPIEEASRPETPYRLSIFECRELRADQISRGHIMPYKLKVFFEIEALFRGLQFLLTY